MIAEWTPAILWKERKESTYVHVNIKNPYGVWNFNIVHRKTIQRLFLWHVYLKYIHILDLAHAPEFVHCVEIPILYGSRLNN